MQPPVFYAPPDCLDNDTISLPKNEAHHAARVMRLKKGDMIVVVDGLGIAYRGELATVSTRGVTVRVHTTMRNFGEPSAHLTLAAGLSAGSKFDNTVQRGTELGAARFVPLVTEKSKVSIDDPKRAKSRVTRLQKVALAAMKQCRRSVLPSIAVPMSTKRFLSEHDRDETLGLLFNPAQETVGLGTRGISESTDLRDALGGDAPKRVSLLVGPEAGFSADEVELAVDAGFKLVSLGPRILRTETAGPVVVALVMSLLGELI